uniref:sodium-coupled monocarboxylate transporter 1-like n=1 Tax=Styela clava TaxID=7725 RepID=UPI001939AA4F|nr:sodium-coupled monocarboxylate transporter 1-like [Styela clava]
MEKRTFAAADYAVFGLMLALSAAIGIFYAIKDRRSKDGTEGYLLAGRSMSIWPVAASLTVSFMSAITVLGTPAEMYWFGTMFWWLLLVFIIVAIVVSQVYIPLFYTLGITSTYEYLEMRFNRPVRILGTFCYLIQNVLYMGIVIYGPALALNEVTGFDLWMAVFTTGLVCTFYTTLGGLKAVLWTDVFQGIVMCAGFIAVIIKGSELEGGFGNVWRKCEEGGRIDFLRFDTDLRIRHSFWSMVLGGAVLWVSVYGVNQSQVQRYLCCKSVKRASQALYLNVAGLYIVVSLACMTGLVIYARYSACDPINQGCVDKKDQLFPYLVMDILHDYPGVPGLFVACVFSGSLSTVSSGINAMATVTIEDLIKPFAKWSERTYMWITKGLVILFGLCSIGVAVLASYLGGILQAAYSILGMIGGPLIGLYTLGVYIPFCNSIGAFTGLVGGVVMTTWMYIGSQSYKAGPEFTRELPRNTTNCPAYCNTIIGSENSINATTMRMEVSTATNYIYNTTAFDNTEVEEPAIAEFYKISYHYVTCIGMACTVILGMIVGLMSCGWRQRVTVDPNLMAPFFDHKMFCWIPEKIRYYLRFCVKGKVPPKPEQELYDISRGVYTENSLANVTASPNGGYENQIRMEE